MNDVQALLVDRIAERIRSAGGWIGFDDYMRAALYEPGLGYYTSGLRKFGRYARDGSDFVTAPELGSVFGRTLARQIDEVLAVSSPQVIEFGAGSGKLAADLLTALGDACSSYRILELSGELRERQRQTIATRAPALLGKVEWLDRLPERFDGCMVGNEVLDAMPVRIVRRTVTSWEELGVGAVDGSTFVWTARPADEPLLASIAACIPRAEALEAGYMTELGLEAMAFTRSVCERIGRGGLLLIDYGFPSGEYYHPQRVEGTLMCHRAHLTHDDPFDRPGLTDITSHVDFSAIAESAFQTGAQIAGYNTQARFLLNAGVLDVITPADALEARLLMNEDEMGELFKVIAITRDLDDRVLCGFTRGDRTARL
ncbi:SAM-dependent methyltransferase [soil metagenome]